MGFSHRILYILRLNGIPFYREGTVEDEKMVEDEPVSKEPQHSEQFFLHSSTTLTLDLAAEVKTKHCFDSSFSTWNESG